MNDMIYREAVERDVPEMIELWKEFIDFHISRDPFFSRSEEGPGNFGKYILKNMADGDALVHVAELDGAVVAYILAMILEYPPAFEIKKYGHVSDLAVASGYRRSGIGMRLFHIARDWFVEKGMNRVEVGVAVTNEISTSFWEKMGFKAYKETRFLEI